MHEPATPARALGAWPLHTVAFATWWVLAVAVHNRDLVRPELVWAPLGLFGASALALLLLIRWFTGNAALAGLLASLGVFWLIAPPPGVGMFALTTVGVVAIGFGAVRARDRLGLVTLWMNVIALVLLLPTLLQFGLWASGAQAPATPSGLHRELLPLGEPEEPLPDVLYVVLDGYGRGDLLAERYGTAYEVEQELQSRGFYVAERSRTNYIRTAHSLSASLNAAYLHDLLDVNDITSGDTVAFHELIAENRVMRTFRSAGYRIAVSGSAYSLAEIADADVVHAPPRLTEHGHTLLSLSVLTPLTNLATGEPGRLQYKLHAAQVESSFRAIEQVPTGGPTFTFVHVFSPHPPFVFEEDGSYRPNPRLFSFAEGHRDHPSRSAEEEYVEGYRGVTRYLAGRLGRALDVVLASDRPTVVLVQGDHGPGPVARERYPILNAMRFPDGDHASLYPEMSPVNSFRIVLREVFDSPVPLLEDRTFETSLERAFEFHEVEPESPAR